MDAILNLNIPVTVPNGYPLETLKKQVTEYVKSLIAKSRTATQGDMSVFESISGAWDDGTSAEEETRKIRAARISGLTRHIEDF